MTRRPAISNRALFGAVIMCSEIPGKRVKINTPVSMFTATLEWCDKHVNCSSTLIGSQCSKCKQKRATPMHSRMRHVLKALEWVNANEFLIAGGENNWMKDKRASVNMNKRVRTDGRRVRKESVDRWYGRVRVRTNGQKGPKEGVDEAYVTVRGYGRKVWTDVWYADKPAKVEQRRNLQIV